MSEILKRIGGYVLIAMLVICSIGFWVYYFQDDIRDMLMSGFALTWLYIGIEKVRDADV